VNFNQKKQSLKTDDRKSAAIRMALRQLPTGREFKDAELASEEGSAHISRMPKKSDLLFFPTKRIRFAIKKK